MKQRLRMRITALAAAAPLLSACSQMPAYERPAPAVPATWPAGTAPATTTVDALPAAPDWREIFRDPVLQRLVERALVHNQDLALALANIAEARGLLLVQRAERLPRLDAQAAVTAARTSRQTAAASASASGTGAATRDLRSTTYELNVGLAAFEIDLFGRVRSLSEAAQRDLLASEAAARATRLALVAEVANAYVTHATDRSLLQLARDTAASAERSVRLVRARLDGGVAPRSELRQAETVLAQARADVADLTAVVAQDRNALELLLGAPVADAELAAAIENLDALLGELPAGLDSRVLLRRPDVVQAEAQLQAANARIGAARAAFFPTISLTAAAGLASSALDTLLRSSALAWSVQPAVALPIFDGGANRGNLAAAQARRDAAVAQYQRTIQTAFREVADALARRGTIDEQLAAQQQLVDAAADSFALIDARYRAGVDPFLNSLDAQRTLYAAQRALTSARLVRAANRVELFRSLGGDAGSS
jgi:outer membrane protein, multidrug efflux system